MFLFDNTKSEISALTNVYLCEFISLEISTNTDDLSHVNLELERSLTIKFQVCITKINA